MTNSSTTCSITSITYNTKSTCCISWYCACDSSASVWYSSTICFPVPSNISICRFICISYIGSSLFTSKSICCNLSNTTTSYISCRIKFSTSFINNKIFIWTSNNISNNMRLALFLDLTQTQSGLNPTPVIVLPSTPLPV